MNPSNQIKKEKDYSFTWARATQKQKFDVEKSLFSFLCRTMMQWIKTIQGMKSMTNK